MTTELETALHWAEYQSIDPMTKVLAAEVMRLRELPAQIVLYEVRLKNARLVCKKPLVLQPVRITDPRGFNVEHDTLGIDVFEKFETDLLDAVQHQIGVVWEEYALAKDESLTEGACALKRRLLNAFSFTESTPSSHWRAAGQPDPHAGYYDGERAALCLGSLTDDEIANAVYMDPNIANLTGAKERIRWLSRALVKALATSSVLPGEQKR